VSIRIILVCFRCFIHTAKHCGKGRLLGEDATQKGPKIEGKVESRSGGWGGGENVAECG